MGGRRGPASNFRLVDSEVHPVPAGPDPDELRSKAWRKVYEDAGAYTVVNAILVMVWFLGGHHGSFWPEWSLGIWGLLLAGQAAKTFNTDYEAPAAEEVHKAEFGCDPSR